MTRPPNPLGELAAVTRSLAEQQGVDATLWQIVQVAPAILPGAEHASLSLARTRRNVSTVAATGDEARRADAVQYETNEGPCLDAIREQRTVHVDDARNDDRWPEFSKRAHEVNVRSMLSFFLFVDGHKLGALNLHASRPRSFNDDDRQVGELLAAQAAVAWDHAVEIDGLKAAAATRGLIGQAQGVLMSRYKIDGNDAFDLLRLASQKRNVKLRHIATEVVETGDLSPE